MQDVGRYAFKILFIFFLFYFLKVLHLCRDLKKKPNRSKLKVNRIDSWKGGSCGSSKEQWHLKGIVQDEVNADELGTGGDVAIWGKKEDNWEHWKQEADEQHKPLIKKENEIFIFTPQCHRIWMFYRKGLTKTVATSCLSKTIHT